MALLYPSDPHCRNHSERQALDDLRTQLDDDFRIYANVDFMAARGTHEGEIDAVILHPELGLLFLEVKGDGVERDASGQWFRTDRGQRVPLKKDPFAQVQDHARALAREISRRLGRAGVRVPNRDVPLPWVAAVYFPFSENPTGPLPLSIAEGHLLTLTDRPRLGDRIRALMEENTRLRRRTATPALAEHVHSKALMPGFRLASSLGAVMDAEHGETVRLDERQALVLDSLEENPRFAVVGGAGTGKSILALEAARRFAQRGAERVLYTCFNRMLADHAARAFEETPGACGRVTARHFHALCQDAACRSGRATAFQSELAAAHQAGIDAERDFWDNRAVEVLFEAIAAGHIEGFDALILDEAQDMRPHWWPELEALGRNGRSTPMIVFFDPDQAIFGHEAAIPEDLFRFRLLENYRNPRALSEWVCALTEQPLRPHPHAPDGDAPVLHAWTDRPAVLRTLNESVAELRAQGVGPERMAIIAPHTLRNPQSTLHGVGEVAGMPLTTDPEAGPGKLLYATITRFKGLERDVVFLLDIDPDDPLCGRRHRYVGASRARRRLHVFSRGPFVPEGD